MNKEYDPIFAVRGPNAKRFTGLDYLYDLYKARAAQKKADEKVAHDAIWWKDMTLRLIELLKETQYSAVWDIRPELKAERARLLDLISRYM